jgi:hypothetical protein
LSGYRVRTSDFVVGISVDRNFAENCPAEVLSEVKGQDSGCSNVRGIGTFSQCKEDSKGLASPQGFSFSVDQGQGLT